MVARKARLCLHCWMCCWLLTKDQSRRFRVHEVPDLFPRQLVDLHHADVELLNDLPIEIGHVVRQIKIKLMAERNEEEDDLAAPRRREAGANMCSALRGQR